MYLMFQLLPQMFYRPVVIRVCGIQSYLVCVCMFSTCERGHCDVFVFYM